MSEQEYLAHHGIKGMKWGVRRTPEQLGHPRSKKKAKSIWKKSAETLNNARKSRKQKKLDAKLAKQRKKEETGYEKYSDEELKKMTDRLNLERNYRNVYAEMHPDKLKRVKRVIGDLAENAVRTIGQKAISAAVEKAFSKKTEEASITKTDYADISKVSDKDLTAALKRLQSENLYKDAVKKKKGGSEQCPSLTQQRRSIMGSFGTRFCAERFPSVKRLRWRCTGLTS